MRLVDAALPFLELLPSKTFRGHRNDSFYVKSAFSPDERFFASGSCDHCVYIWEVGGSADPILKLTGHSQEVNSVDWCDLDGPLLVSSSDDLTVRLWRPPAHQELDGVGPRTSGRSEVCSGWFTPGEQSCKPQAAMPPFDHFENGALELSRPMEMEF